MASFENKINDMFNSGNTEMPDGYSWEENKEAIYSKMPQKDETRIRPLILLLFKLITIVLISLIGLYFLKKENSNHLFKTEEDTKENIDHQIEQNLTDITSSSYNSENTVFDGTNSIESISPENKSKLDTKDISHNPHKSIYKKGNISLSNMHNAHSQKTYLTSQNHVNTRKKVTNLGLALTGKIVQQNQNNSEIKIDSKFFLLSPLLSTKQLPPLHNEHYLDITNKVKTIPKTKTNTITNHTFTIGGGTLLSSGGYEGIENKNQYFKWLPGYHATVGYTFTKNRLAANLYYDHSFAVQLFEFSSIDSVLVNQEGEIIVTDPYTGQIEHLTTSQSTSSPRTREYKTYNTFRSHSFGISLNYRILEYRRFSAYAGLGARFAFAIRSKGYSILENNEIIKYSNQNPIYRQDRIDITGNININFHITEKLDILSYVRYNRGLNNLSLDSDHLLKNNQTLLGLGISYNLK